MSDKCKEVRDLILGYPEDFLTDAEKLAVKSHADECRDCAALQMESNQAWSVLDKFEGVEPEGDFVGKFWNKVAEEDNKAREKVGFFDVFKIWKYNLARIGALAAILIVSLVSLDIFESERAAVVYTAEDRADEELLRDMDKTISKQTADILDIYGLWSDEIKEDNKGG